MRRLRTVDDVAHGPATGEPSLQPAEEQGRRSTEEQSRQRIEEQSLQQQERFEDELIMHLERDQFVFETARPVPRAALGARATAGLWALRIFVVLVSMMVIYAFIDQLH
jgi:parvulin-like peptidyl-prolyl isomerase